MKPVRIRLKWALPVPVRYIVLREQIALSQRVERFEVSLTLNGQETMTAISNDQKTIANIGRMGRDGMKSTDVEILKIMLGK